jgi:phosphatidate phosphatase
MAYTRQGDIHTVGTSRQNLIPYDNYNEHRSPNRNTITDESNWSPTQNSQQHHPANRNIFVEQNPANKNHQQRSTNRNMFTEEPQLNPPTTTDQYHHTETIWRVIIDIISLGILTTVTVISHYIATPFTRGFFCSDTMIRYPYKGDTIPVYAAVLLSIGLPIVWMWTTEFCKRSYFSYYRKQSYVTRLELCGGSSININPFFRNLYILTVVFAYGYLATWVLTEVTKNFVGELRPHFLAVCQPTFNCSNATLDQFNSYIQYGSGYTCLNTDDTAVREARRSFFSGHTSPIFFGFGWLVMYIHVSWSWRHLGILGHLFQVGLAILGLYIGYTRISDFHHHWHDVFVGGLVGSLVAFVTFKFILNWRHYNPRFLPHTVPSAHTKPTGTLNGGMQAMTTRRITPSTDYEHQYF